MRTLYPQIRVRAETQVRRAPVKDAAARPTVFADPPAAEVEDEPPQLMGSSPAPEHQRQHEAGTKAEDAVATTAAPETDALQEEAPAVELNEVQSFLEEVQRQVDQSRWERNQAIPYPTHPDHLVPAFRRLRRHTPMKVVVPDPDYPTFTPQDHYAPLPKPATHPWVKSAPIGPHITHGDGQIGVIGTGEVGFDESPVAEPLPRDWRGLQHRSVVRHCLPQKNGKVRQDVVVKHSFALTGRGIFATRPIHRGETIMIVQSTAQSVGVKGEIRRLEEMIVDILVSCYEGDDEMRAFLHEWILTGQPSSLLEYWPQEATTRVIKAIGGEDVLASLELHPIHIARLGAILDLNSFLVESFFAERKGMAYFPEAALLNHSCDPNASYEVMPEHVFRESDYFLDEAEERDGGAGKATTEAADEEEGEEDAASVGAASSSPPAATSSKEQKVSRDDDQQGGVSEHAAAHPQPLPSTSPFTTSSEKKRDEGDGQAEGTVAQPAPEPTPSPGGDRKDTAANGRGRDPAQPDAVVVGTETRNVAHFGDTRTAYPDLTEASAPTYLFCCRATRDIAPGEEVLISYVPAEWSFENRQYVLHDRYRFWCKCPRCSPTLESKYARVPRLLVFLIIFSVLLQGLVMYQRSTIGIARKAESDRRAVMTEEERKAELRERGIDRGDRSTPLRRPGLLEMLEEKRLNSVDGIIRRGGLSSIDIAPKNNG